MQWLSELPLGDNRVLQIAVFAFAALAVLIVLAIVYRLVFAHRLRVPGGRTRQPRLGLVDAFSLDGQRQLVLIRRDNIEHLVMIGGPNDVLVESQINRALTPAREANHVAQQPHLAAAAPARRAEPVAPQAPQQPTASPSVPPRVAAAEPVAPPPQMSAPVPPQPVAAIARTSPPSQGEMRPSRPAADQGSSAPLPATAPTATASEGAHVVAPSTSPVSPVATPSQGSRPVTRESVIQKPTEALRAALTQPPPPVRALPARPSMPPPIIPARAVPSTGQDKPILHAPGQPKLGDDKGLVPVGASLGKMEPMEQVKQDKIAAPTASEARIIPTTQAVIIPPAPKSEEIATPVAGKGDPFADLDTLEAEMARLLGRDKL